MALTAAQTSALNDLVRQVFVYERVKDDEFTDVVDGQMFVLDALAAHNPNYTVDTIPPKERVLVVILARVRVTEARLSRMLQEFPVAALSASADRSSPASNLRQHRIDLLDEYQRVADALGVEIGGGTTQIFMGTLVRDETIFDQQVPLDDQQPPGQAILSLYKKGADYISLSWTPPSELHDFHLYTLYRSTTEDLEDLTTISAANATYKGVVSTATRVVEINEKNVRYYKDTGLAAGTYYYVLVVEDSGGLISVSDELEVTIP